MGHSWDQNIKQKKAGTVYELSKFNPFSDVSKYKKMVAAKQSSKKYYL